MHERCSFPADVIEIVLAFFWRRLDMKVVRFVGQSLSQHMTSVLLLLALSTVFIFGNDRSHFYRPGHHNWVSSEHLAVAVNLSPEHNFLMFHRQTLDANGAVSYQPYNRFPIGGYALIKAATLPFSDDLSAQIYAARMLMLLFFAAAAVLAYLALSRLMPDRWIALTATLLAVSSPYCLYYSDMINPETVVDLFGVMLTFHGLVVFVQEDRFGQLLGKACAGLLLGWHVFALLLTFIILGMASELVRAFSRLNRGGVEPVAALRPSFALAGRYLTLGVVSLLFGSSLLALNFTNEYFALNGNQSWTDLPSFQSMLDRTGQNPDYNTLYADALAWPFFLERLFSHIGSGISVPFSLLGYINDAAAERPTASGQLAVPWESHGFTVGAVMFCACLLSLTCVRRVGHGILLATLALFGFCWSLPMRHTVVWHDYESLYHIGMPLVLFSLVLSYLRHLFGNRPVYCLSIAALWIFCSSSYQMGRVGHSAEGADFHRAIIADFETIRDITAGRSVRAATPEDVIATRRFAGATHALDYYLAGSVITFQDQHGDPPTDFLLTRGRVEHVATLTTGNRFRFLYSSAIVDAYRSIAAGERPRRGPSQE